MDTTDPPAPHVTMRWTSRNECWALLREAVIGRLAVVVDGAQGAASALAPEVYRAAGAEVHAIHCEADGWRINDGSGATHPEALAAALGRVASDSELRARLGRAARARAAELGPDRLAERLDELYRSLL